MRFCKFISCSSLIIMVLAFGFMGSAIAQEMVTAGLVSFWTFDRDDIVGGTAKDMWGNNHGEINGAEIVAGKIDEALSFDGEDDFVEVKHSKSLNIVEEITIEFWFLLKGESVNNDWPRVVGKGQSTTANGAYGVWVKDVTGATDIGLRSITLAPNDIRSTEIPNYDDDSWHHVAVTYDGDVGRIYFDGEIHFDSSVSGELNETDEALHIGDANNERYFNGLIDEVRIYNRALSEDEVLQNFGVKLNALAVESTHKLTVLWSDIKTQ